MPTQPHMVEALLRSQLMAHMTDDERRDLALRFEVRPFSAGQTLIADGSEGRKLLEILAATAEVRVRDGEHGYRVAQLGPGSISGEAAFYAGTARGADVIGTSEGIVAVLSRTAYLSLIQQNRAAAEALDKTVLEHLSQRVIETNARLGALLTAKQDGGLKGALQTMLGIKDSVPVVDHG